MKKLLTTLVAGIILLGTNQTAIANHIKIPEKFQNYQLKSKLILEGTDKTKSYKITDYDLEGDKNIEVRELRKIIGKNGKQYIVFPYPIIYGFDINNNGKIEYEEMILDEAMDGWNGNEKLYLPRKQLPKKKEIFI